MTDPVCKVLDPVEVLEARVLALEQSYQRLLRSIRDSQLMTVREIEKQIKK
jgi:hypothetical protein